MWEERAGQGWPTPMRVCGQALLYQLPAVFSSLVFCDFGGLSLVLFLLLSNLPKIVQLLKSSKISKCVPGTRPLTLLENIY